MSKKCINEKKKTKKKYENPDFQRGGKEELEIPGKTSLVCLRNEKSWSGMLKAGGTRGGATPEGVSPDRTEAHRNEKEIHPRPNRLAQEVVTWGVPSSVKKRQERQPAKRCPSCDGQRSGRKDGGSKQQNTTKGRLGEEREKWRKK